MNHLAALRRRKRLRMASSSHTNAVGCVAVEGEKIDFLVERRNQIARLLGGQGSGVSASRALQHQYSNNLDLPLTWA